MNVNHSPNATNAGDLLRSNPAEITRSSGVQQTPPAAGAGAGTGTSGASSTDDVHLSELVRTLRSLAADSPERQMQIEQLARAAANGSYRVDAHATADAIINDAASSVAA